MTVDIPIKVGDLVTLAEPDYCYGMGKLVLRITELPERLADPEWVDIRGIEIAWNGDRRKERQVRARISALRKPQNRQMP